MVDTPFLLFTVASTCPPGIVLTTRFSVLRAREDVDFFFVDLRLK
jgi:hypothetical protein